VLRKFLQPILDDKVNLQERIFRLIAGIGVIALVLMLLSKLFTGENISNLLVLTGCILCIILSGAFFVRKNKVNLGATVVAILLVVFLPLNFFMAGGMYGGAPLWFVFVFVYISLTLYGIRRLVFLLLGAAEAVSCYYVSFYYPEYIMQHTLSMAYLDSVLSVILVGALASVMILFQNRIYQEENRISNRQKKEIEELNKAENHFFSSMSHEIRTPINTIIGLNEMILRSEVSDDIAENARNIQGASKMLLTLINDILDLSKIESGKMDIVKVPYETGALFSEIINMIWIKARQKGLEFHLDVDSSMPSMLCGDEVRIKQILINVLNNAVKYTKEGSITLLVRCERKAEDKVKVYYSVKDTGQGVKKEDIPYLFNAFHRVDEKKNRHIEGTGLGLSIVKQLVNLMGGEISVNSVYTKGSTFLITLEQEIVDETELGIFTLESRMRKQSKAHYKQSFEAPEARLLIVDDNSMNLMVAKKLLSDTKIKIDTAESGEECLKMTQTKHYDGILMDHLMPGMDGIECLHAIRTQTAGLCREVPVIALTANAGSENQLLYRKEGFNGYLAKPVSGALLEAAVIKILPKEMVLLNEDAMQSELGKDVLVFDQRKRVPLMVTTDSVCDLPEGMAKRLGISVNPYFVCTEHGRFLDGRELETDDLLDYLYKGKKGASKAPDVSHYESFFAEKLTEAQNIIHIAMAEHASEGYGHACEAAKSFENVTVIDSGHLSSGMGLAALYAAYMVGQNASSQEIVQKVESLKNDICTSFIVNNTQMLYRGGRVSKEIHVLCNTLLLHPVIVLQKSRMTVGGIRMGSFRHVSKQYIRAALRNAKEIDRRILFLTYAGMDEKSLEEIQEMIREYCPFDKIYLQKASSAIACNCGAGSFGLLFMKNRGK